MAQSSSSWPSFRAYARMAASTDRACFRSPAPSVCSWSRARAPSRLNDMGADVCAWDSMGLSLGTEMIRWKWRPDKALGAPRRRV